MALEQSLAVMITGASEGIGFACASTLLNKGHIVCLVSRNIKKLKAAREILNNYDDDKIMIFPADISIKNEMDAAAIAMDKRFMRIDALINSAGISASEPHNLDKVSTEEYTRIMRTNVDGTYYAAQAVLPFMKKKGGGYIINVLSLASNMATAGSSAYCASKYAAKGITETLILECRGSGIRVSSISPGPCATAIWSHKTIPPDEEMLACMIQPSDVADAAIFLLERPAGVHIRDIEITHWNWIH